jgi:hypothetical protein
MDTLPEDHCHLRHVKLLCRICSQRVKLGNRKAEGKQCADYEEKILSVYGIDVSSDNSVYYPHSFCERCYKRMSSLKHRKCYSHIDKYAIKQAQTLNRKWAIQECTADCWVCLKFQQQSKGGRPKKRYTKKKVPHHSLPNKTNISEKLFPETPIHITIKF